MSVRVGVSKSGGWRGRSVWAQAATAWADEMGPLVLRALRDKAPVARDGQAAGRLRDSIRDERRINPGRVAIEFTASAPYTKYVIEGTGPHVIRVRNAQALHWKDAAGSHFAQSVNHPGTRANNFPRRAIEPLEPLIRRRLAEILREAIGGR